MYNIDRRGSLFFYRQGGWGRGRGGDKGKDLRGMAEHRAG